MEVKWVYLRKKSGRWSPSSGNFISNRKNPSHQILRVQKIKVIKVKAIEAEEGQKVAEIKRSKIMDNSLQINPISILTWKRIKRSLAKEDQKAPKIRKKTHSTMRSLMNQIFIQSFENSFNIDLANKSIKSSTNKIRR
jgi:hypothetical protein